jgi:hypothetical protein
MANTFALESPDARLDAVQFLERAARVNNGSARLIADGNHLQMYVGMLVPRGLLDQTPTVLGMRVFRLRTQQTFDVVVPIESLVHRLLVTQEENAEETRVPAEVATLSWASITPPREGWRRRLGVSSEALRSAAEHGVKKVAEVVPGTIGESVLQKVRAEVWGTMIPTHKRIPAGAAFAADALGFLGDKPLTVHSLGNWVRLSATSGYVLVKFSGGFVLGDEDSESG